MEIKSRSLPNLGVVESKLSDSLYKDLWNLIEDAKVNKIDIKNTLAGNISSSLSLDIEKAKILNDVINSMISEYQENLGVPWHSLRSNKVKNKINLDSLWVNFQYQNEFNPTHEHSGAFSFVIWMKIPTYFKDQAQKKIALDSNMENKISNFVLVYTDIIGNIREVVYEMSPDQEGVILLFPSRLRHQVYPFYDCEDARVTISGNIGLIQNI